MALKGVSVPAAGATAAGALFLWSGIRGVSVTQTLKSLIAGQAPSTATTHPVAAAPGAPGAAGGGGAAPGDTGAHGASAAANQAAARLLAAPYGWSVGHQWEDLVSLWNRESGWNNLAMNSSSGAFGIAQALGHGTASSGGKYGNQYPSRAANDGDATAQIAWGLSYIHQRYGSPSAAWAHETSAGWY